MEGQAAEEIGKEGPSVLAAEQEEAAEGGDPKGGSQSRIASPPWMLPAAALPGPKGDRQAVEMVEPAAGPGCVTAGEGGEEAIVAVAEHAEQAHGDADADEVAYGTARLAARFTHQLLHTPLRVPL